MFRKTLMKAGLTVIHTTGDSDTKIISEGLSSARNSNTTVIGEDTDLLALLLHHVCAEMKNIFFKSFKPKVFKIWDLKEAQTIIGKDILCKHIAYFFSMHLVVVIPHHDHFLLENKLLKDLNKI